MSTILITNESRTDRHAAVELTDGRKSVYIGLGRSGAITVCMLNASHRAWKGGGRTFWGFDEARDAYKSAFMKSAISMASEYL